jgi:PEP-CTERM motif
LKINELIATKENWHTTCFEDYVYPSFSIKELFMNNVLKKVALAAVVSASGFAMPVLAVPQFSVNTGLFMGAGGQLFDANSLAGTASSILQVIGGNQIIGHGYTRFTSFNSDTNPTLNFFDTGLTNNATNGYSMWAEYSFVTTLATGPYAGANSTYNINSLTFTLYGEKNNGAANNSVFTAANNANVGSASVAQSADTINLGSGAVFSGTSTINNLLGTSLNASMLFALTPSGSSFFYAPNPFYDLAFSSFTNTSQGFAPNPFGVVAINSAVGGADFNNRTPEPGSLALLGLGLVGLVAARRRQAAKA